jgi:hypothetical protein
MQDCGNQRSRVTDTDPENEVGDIPCPSYGDVVSPNAYPGEQKIEDAKYAKPGERAGNSDGPPPPGGRRPFHDPGNEI